MDPNLTLRWLPFDRLRLEELYALLRLRQQVFVVEQRCAYQDCDDLDFTAWHLLLQRGDELVGGARLLPPATDHGARLGRVVIAPAWRGHGLGRGIIRAGIDQARSRYPGPLTLHAQAHLRRLYEGEGFAVDGPPFDEDGIPHLPMRLV